MLIAEVLCLLYLFLRMNQRGSAASAASQIASPSPDSWMFPRDSITGKRRVDQLSVIQFKPITPTPKTVKIQTLVAAALVLRGQTR